MSEWVGEWMSERVIESVPYQVPELDRLASRLAPRPGGGIAMLGLRIITISKCLAGTIVLTHALF